MSFFKPVGTPKKPTDDVEMKEPTLVEIPEAEFGRQTSQVIEQEEDVEMLEEAPEVKQEPQNHISNENGGSQTAKKDEALEVPVTNPVSLCTLMSSLFTF